jgi:hypothetical protein
MLSGKHTPAEIRQVANTAWGYRTALGKPLRIPFVCIVSYYRYLRHRSSDRAHAGTTYSIRMKLGESFKNRVE